MLSASGIYMLDFESEVFVWIGKLVPKNKQTYALKIAIDAIQAVNSKGQSRLEKITISIVHYGFEPDIFKSAFRQGWSRLDQPGIDDKR